MSDGELVQRLLDRDTAAFQELVRRHHAMMLAFARGFVRDAALAEELVQETWIAVIEGLRGFEHRSTLKTWIYAILANKARSAATRAARMISFSELGPADDSAVDPDRFRPDGHWAAGAEPLDEMTPERLAESRETSALIRDAIEALPGAQRAVLILRDIEGEDGRSVAAMLDISEGNQRILLHRARNRIRNALEASLGADRPGRAK